MNNWFPQTSEPYFGTRRTYEMKIGKFKLIGDIYVSDIRRRSFRERWFTRPWKPFKRTEYSPTAYIVDNKILVSIQTFLRFENEKQ